MANVRIDVLPLTNTDTDPTIIEIYYPSIYNINSYIPPKIILEIGARSLFEPFSYKEINSYISEIYKKETFKDPTISIPCANPQSTFLEKIFLLHEEFQRPIEKIRTESKSRHLFDIEKLMDTIFGMDALLDSTLYRTIVTHREKFTAIRGIDYTNHHPSKINIIPPTAIYAEWEKDYQLLQNNMLQGDSLSFTDLIARLKVLNKRINEM